MNKLKTSENGIKLIKHYEGCQLKAYLCHTGKITIGFGHTSFIKGRVLTINDVITQEEANNLLKEDIVVFEKGVNQLVSVPINQNQFDAMASLAFNIGLGNFKESSVLKNVNKKDFTNAEKSFMLWVNVNHKPCQGLIKRRSSEVYLFSNGKLNFQ